jgi:tetratricopeptide (TPR) repeat protein
MAEGLTSEERQEVLALLRHAFEEAAAETLVVALDRVVGWRADGVTRQDFQGLQALMGQLVEGQRELQAALTRLAEAQARTEERVGRLEEAQIRAEERMARLEDGQRRLEEAMARLAEAQARTEERVGRLEEAMARLAEAQARTEERVGRLEEVQIRTEERMARLEDGQRQLVEGQRELQAALIRLAEAQVRTEKAQARTEKELRGLRRQVGGLSDTVGGEFEDMAYIVLHDVLKRELGWDVSPLARTWQQWGGKAEEVNIFGQARDPSQPEQPVWIVGEAKHNLTLKQVERLAKQVERARQYLTGRIFPVCFCYRTRPEVQARIQELGIRLVFSYGRMV